ncbi:hypothetical protein Btru_043982 [Bulinus truncatus]|nr:hypothetical protein Btru_043982 [Bulinus truncatus]
MAEDPDWTWCTIIIVIILVILLLIMIVGGTCALALHLRGSDRRRTPPEYYPMEFFPATPRSFTPIRDQRLDVPPQAPYSSPYGVGGQQPMPLLTPYQQYLIAQNWSNMYKAYQQSQAINNKDSKLNLFLSLFFLFN